MEDAATALSQKQHIILGGAVTVAYRKKGFDSQPPPSPLLTNSPDLFDLIKPNNQRKEEEEENYRFNIRYPRARYTNEQAVDNLEASARKKLNYYIIK